ncbi:MAG: acetyl-CoA C-acetyltransferase [Brachybacterium tyrofermentans]|uniref:acetyl-CoA C-acetyltransferase n=1 Tax=Brachybacterium tyrofermentans TaxID=47848 RepID=UPI000A1B6917|nr:acetyl-CoA C-acetyltransferase [Brachybacterium tyrofermentans]SLN00142.1 3-ketoacyl-CoA thiolase @ Acetyl-CoA acetyltransferase [Corynebacterium xerosis]
MTDFPRDALILGGNRIPFARSGGPYAGISNQDLLTAALDGLVARFSLQGEKLGEIAGGAVLKLAGDLNLTRESALGTPLDPRTPALDMSRACATSLETMVHLSNRIQLGQIDSGIACGVDSASDSPIEVTPRLRRILHRAFAAKTAMQRVKALSAIRPADLTPVPPRNGEPRTGLSMGEHQALTGAQWGITREAQDELALASHQNLAAAYDAGFFDDLVTGYRGLARDQNLRADSTLEKLGSLKPVFGVKSPQVSEPTMTAGNSTPLSDGASAVLMGSQEWADEHGLTPLARVVDARSAAVDFAHGAEGLLMAPAYAVPEMLDDNGLTLQDLDLYEIHEAFASTVLSTLAAWESEEFCREKLGRGGPLGAIDRSKLNVTGSSLAAGHPFAATGGRLVATLSKLLHQRAVETGRVQRGLISVCAAAGQGAVVLLESVTD